MNTCIILARLSKHCRDAGVQRAEKALRELTDAAGQLGIAECLTKQLVALWNAVHGGREAPLVWHRQPTLGPVEGRDKRFVQRERRCSLNRLESPEGQAALRDVLDGKVSGRQAARVLGVSPVTLGQVARRLRKEEQRRELNDLLTNSL